MLRRYFVLILLSLLYLPSVSSAAINFNDQIWQDISARSRGETILLPMAMESFSSFMNGIEPRNGVEAVFLRFFNEHPQYIESIKRAYAALGNLGAVERENLGAFRSVTNSAFSIPLIKGIAATNTEISFGELMFS